MSEVLNMFRLTRDVPAIVVSSEARWGASQRYKFEFRRGNGHFFPSYRQLYLSSFSNTLHPTQWRSLQMPDVAVPQRGV